MLGRAIRACIVLLGFPIVGYMVGLSSSNSFQTLFLPSFFHDINLPSKLGEDNVKGAKKGREFGVENLTGKCCGERK